MNEPALAGIIILGTLIVLRLIAWIVYKNNPFSFLKKTQKVIK